MKTALEYTTIKFSKELADKIDEWMNIPENRDTLKMRGQLNRTGAVVHILIKELQDSGITE